MGEKAAPLPFPRKPRFSRIHIALVTITQLIRNKPPPTLNEFRLRFAASSPISELVLSHHGLMGNILIRGENYGGRNQALTTPCGDAAAAGFGVIYITEGLVSSLVDSLRKRRARHLDLPVITRSMSPWKKAGN